MRTKHILTALALPALLAACTADDFNESLSNGKQLQREALKSGLVLNFDGADTRFSAGDPDAAVKFAYEVGDTIGGAIIDQYSIVGGEKNFEVVDYVSTNHPFVKGTDGTWAIKHTMVEGNYLFYYPYNENNHERGAVKYSIPVLQDLSDKKTGEFNPKAAIERYNMGVGAQFLDKEDLSAGTDLVNLFSYARIKVTIDNHYAGGNVDKIVLQGNDFALNGQISNKKVSALFGNDDFETALADMTETAEFCIASNEDFYDAALNETSSVMVAKFPANTALEVDKQNNKSIEAYMVLPAANYSQINLYLYMADGKVYTGTIPAFEANRNKIKGLEVIADLSTTAPYVVTSEADWNNYVSLIKKNETANFIIAGENFSISNDTKYPTAEGAKITVDGNLKVSGNNVTLKKIEAETVTVLKDAKLNITDELEAEEVVNEGAVAIEKVTDKDGDVVIIDKVGTITNKPGATLNIEKDAVAEFILMNNIDNKVKTMVHGVVVNEGIVTLESSSENYGEITNNGTLKGEFTNKTEQAYTNNNATTKVFFTPVITNNNEIFATGTVKNEGEIVNAGEITCSKLGGSAAFNNAGVLTVKDGTKCLITSNDGGEIVLEKISQTGWSVEKAAEQGTIAYSTGSADADKSYDFTATGKGITKIYVNGNLGITKYGALTEIVVAKAAKLALPKDVAWTGEVTVKEGVAATITSEAASIGHLEVEAGAKVTIDKDNNLTTNTVLNAGTVYVGGTFTATVTPEADAVEGKGVFKSTSSNEDNNIKFAPTEGDKKKANYEKAVRALVDAWIENNTTSPATAWSGVVVSAIAGTTWTDNTTPWIKVAAEAYLIAYKAFYSTELEASGMATAINQDSEYVDDAITAAKEDADGKTGKAIANNFSDYTWIGTEAYMKKAADAKLEEIVDAGGTTMVSAFLVEVKKLNKAATGSQAVVFSLAALEEEDITSNMIPAGSYINVYATSEEYKAMKMWQEAVTTLAAYSGEEWYTANVQKYLFDGTIDTNNTTLRMQNFFNEINKVPTTGDALLDKALKPFKNMINTVIDWEYTDQQIQALASEVKK